MAFLPLCKVFVTKNDRFLEIETLFSRTERLKTQECNQCGEIFIVLEDSISTARIFVANNLIWLYTLSSQKKKKSKQNYLLAKMPFFFQNENRGLNNTYRDIKLTFSIFHLFLLTFMIN